MDIKTLTELFRYGPKTNLWVGISSKTTKVDEDRDLRLSPRGKNNLGIPRAELRKKSILEIIAVAQSYGYRISRIGLVLLWFEKTGNQEE